jgi:hypothetical protein
MKFVLLFFVIVSILSCSVKYDRIEKVLWLQGKWESNIHGKKICEEWKLVNDSTLFGASYFIQNMDTLIQETMNIEIREGQMFFKAIAIAEDSTIEETKFELLSLTSEKVEFENLLHDFPQKIVYARQNKDSLIAYIDGNYNGQYNRINFPMKRIH